MNDALRNLGKFVKQFGFIASEDADDLLDWWRTQEWEECTGAAGGGDIAEQLDFD